MPLDLYDANNYVRVKFETNVGGLALRQIFEEAYYLPEPAIYVFDGFNSKKMRLAKYPAYKQGRTPTPDNFYHHLNFFKELLLHTKHLIIEVPEVEADDVIGTIARSRPTEVIRIFSTDRDFCCLLREGLTTPMANLKGVAAEDVRLYKTLCGDNSDNIPGLPQFGKGCWEALSRRHKEAWTAWLEGGDFPEDHGVTSKRCLTKMKEQVNLDMLKVFWDIVGLYDVPMDLIAKHMRVGTPDYPLANSKLIEIMQ